jgi:type IV pilus assembly protein PilO
MADNALTRLSLAGQLGVSAAIAALIGGFFYWWFWGPMVQEQTTKAAKLEQLQKDIRALEVTANKLPEFQREVVLLEAKLDTLKRILPPSKETPDLMKKVQYLAVQSNLTIKKFNPSATVTKEFYQEFPITVDVEGTYHNLAMFFDRIRRLSRLVNVGNLKIKSQTKPTASKTIAAACQAITFVYVEGGVPASPAPGARPGARPTPPARTTR